MPEQVAYLAPSEVAARFGVKAEKVLLWIQAGELQAVNAATRRNGQRPRWRISPQALADFEQARASRPAPAPRVRRRRADRDVIQFV